MRVDIRKEVWAGTNLEVIRAYLISEAMGVAEIT